MRTLGTEQRPAAPVTHMPSHCPEPGVARNHLRFLRSAAGRVARCALALGALVAFPGISPLGVQGTTPGTSTEPTPFTEPATLENLSSDPNTVEVELTAAPAQLSLVPGTRTEVLAYNGSVPGPTLEVSEGDRVIVRFRNDLDEPTTVHWHGLHLPFEADGSPFHPVAPGEEYVYEFTISSGTAGTYWYHPHPHHRTGYQVGKGLHGAIIVRDPEDPLPASLPEHLIVLSDNRLGTDGKIDFAESGSRQARVDAENGREGNVHFVNGRILPELEIRSGEVQRWRVINASGARTYRLALPGHTLLHVGSDGGLFERPVEVDEILLAGGERVELLVRGTGKPGERAMLRSLPYDRYLPQTRPGNWTDTLDLAAVRYTGEPAIEAVELPERLRAIPTLDTAQAQGTRQMVLTKNRINGRMMEMDRVDQVARLGATEIWEVENLVGMDHTFHLHGFQFQLLDRDGEPEPFPSWKDVVNVPKRSTVRFIVRFDTHPGKWMFHCHILDHEDAGMMGVLKVRDVSSSTTPTQEKP
jgi:FtsP/CotA-like multicopper oxidase with cupredoxin domain